MGHPSIQEAGSIKQCLELFGRASGLEVNAQKYQVFIFNTPRVTRNNIFRILWFQESFLFSKYLGTPLINSIAKKGSWTNLLDTIKKWLGNWTLRPLNLVSLLVLVNSVLQSMLTYMFSSMMTPKTILRDLRNIQRKFLWSGTQDPHKWAMVKWDIICTPKSQGGLGICNLEKESIVSEVKLWWRWVTHTQEP